jgi:hypothetical protein
MSSQKAKAQLSLYEIASEFMQMADRLRELDLDEQTVADTLEAENGDLIDKLCAVMAVALSMEAEAEQVQRFVLERAQARIVRLTKRAERLRQYALDAMVGTNQVEVKQPDLHFRVRVNPPSVVIDDEKKLPMFFTVVKTVESIDKAAIKKALEAGEDVPGAHVERRKRLEVL